MNFRSERSRDSVAKRPPGGVSRGCGGRPGEDCRIMPERPSVKDSEAMDGERKDQEEAAVGVDPEVVHLRDHQIPQVCSYS